ncbi:MAG: peptidyl-prolyl cis-trans isomerase [Alphaproteobacteria bacterium]|nr:peptidyl-prolyl cis-trans isomerase [Alphaproteobacteria bacterium]
MRTGIFPILFLVLFAGGFAIAQPSAPPSDGDRVVASVNNRQFTMDEAREVYRSLPQSQILPFETLYNDILDYLIDADLFLAAAQRANLEEDEDLQRLIQRAKNQAIVAFYVKTQVEAAVTPQSIREEYRRYLAENPPAQEIRAWHILLDSEQDARDVIARLDRGEDFNKLIKEVSLDSQANPNNTGDLGFFSRDQMPEEISRVAFSLRRGEYSKQPISTRFGWHVIRVGERRQAQPPTLEDVQDELRQRVSQQAYDKLVKDLRSRARIRKHKL